jgi:deoxyribonuclease V
MEFSKFHPWDVTPKEAIRIQQSLRSKVVSEGNPRARLIAGVDVGFPPRQTRGGPIARAAVVVLSFPGLELVEERVAEIPVTFPYVPGLLSFREVPACLEAIRQLKKEPDLFIFDAHGYAHPRRMGLATHLGIILDKPSIGCAKSKLVGEYRMPGIRVGDREDLFDKGEVIGTVVRTKPGSAPLFISIGHKISLSEAAECVLACTKRGNRLPETTRLAHQAASVTFG